MCVSATILVPSPSDQDSYSSSPPVTANGQTEINIGDLINEAMEDDSPSSRVLVSSSTVKDRQTSKQDRGQGQEDRGWGQEDRKHQRLLTSSAEKSGRKRRGGSHSVNSKLQIHQLSENSIHISYSDSDDDIGVAVRSDPVGMGGRGRHSLLDNEEEDEGFCIVDTPTSTSVVSQ